ncbi:MAG: class I SAM-dependent methyltransferase [Miltoncostaeaceae bacterium]
MEINMQETPSSGRGNIATTALERAAASSDQDNGRQVLDILRGKWTELPATDQDRSASQRFLEMSDAEIREQWEYFLDPIRNPRSPYQALYAPHLRGCRVLEVGSGLGIDALYFARMGARWHCVDIATDNLAVIRRVFAAFDLELDGTTLLTDLSALDEAPYDVDVIFCSGSMHHAPFAFTRVETSALCTHLAPGGRWLELSYPRSRWEREGCAPFAKWGEITDGPGTPWAEWYDLDRIRERFAPVSVSPVISFDFEGGDFNWFDLILDAPSGPPSASHGALEAELGGLDPRTHNGATAEITSGPSPRLDVIGTATIWSYAIDLPTDAICRAAGVADDVTTVSIALDLTVHQGRAGVMLVTRDNDDLGEQLGPEGSRAPSQVPTTVFIDRADREHSAIVLRTTGGDGTPMHCSINAIRVYPA